MNKFFLAMAALFSLFASEARAETAECTEIVSIPTVITEQGVYCFKRHQVTSMTSGSAIEIQADNVVIDLNGWKLGGSAAGKETRSIGIFAVNRKNITIRNGSIRGFQFAINLQGSLGSGHLIEDIRADQNRLVGISVQGRGLIVRNNYVFNGGGNSSGRISSGAQIGIGVTSAENAVISDNIIVVSLQANTHTGIDARNSKIIQVIGNSIYGSAVSSRAGIIFSSVSNATVRDNRIINNGGNNIIIQSWQSTGINCFDNVGRGYLIGIEGCIDSSDNHLN